MASAQTHKHASPIKSPNRRPGETEQAWDSSRERNAQGKPVCFCAESSTCPCREHHTAVHTHMCAGTHPPRAHVSGTNKQGPAAPCRLQRHHRACGGLPSGHCELLGTWHSQPTRGRAAGAQRTEAALSTDGAPHPRTARGEGAPTHVQALNKTPESEREERASGV